MNQQLTVRELIDQLDSMPQDSLVWTEGCDCWGEAWKVIDRGNGAVVIARLDGKLSQIEDSEDNKEST